MTQGEINSSKSARFSPASYINPINILILFVLFLWGLTFINFAPWYVSTFQPVQSYVLEIKPENKEQGYNYIVTSPLNAQAFEDSYFEDSWITLYENDVFMGPEDNYHEAIRNDGRGLWDEFSGYIYMSSTDGTDPATNGRTYTLSRKSTLDTTFIKTMFYILVASIIIFLRQNIYNFYRRIIQRFDKRLKHFSDALTLADCVAILLFLTGFILAAIPIVKFVTPSEILSKTLSPNTIYAEEGFNHIANFPLEDKVRGVFEHHKYALLEDGKDLGSEDQSHTYIRESGNGTWDIYGHKIYFSSTDGTSPLENGRVYTFVKGEHEKPSNFLLLTGLSLMLLSLILPQKTPWLERLAGSRLNYATTILISGFFIYINYILLHNYAFPN